jgi:hypothetical protein
MPMTADTRNAELGYLAFHFAGVIREVQVLETTSGYYLDTTEEGQPFTRESQQYWTTRKEAADALRTGAWSQRRSP